MNARHNFNQAEEFITSCTEAKPVEEFFLRYDIKPYFDSYIEKYYGDERKKRSANQIGTSQEAYRLVKSKQDVINYQNYTERMMNEYQEKFNSGNCNNACLENAIIRIEIAFSQYTIALRKLISMNSEEYKCSTQETKDFVLLAFRYEKEIRELKSRNMMMD